MEKLYLVEVGCLSDDEDYIMGNTMFDSNYDGKRGFYDENFVIFLESDYQKALDYGKNYVKDGVLDTYCIMCSKMFEKLTDEETKEIKDFGLCDGIDIDFVSSNVNYSLYKKSDVELVENFVI